MQADVHLFVPTIQKRSDFTKVSEFKKKTELVIQDAEYEEVKPQKSKFRLAAENFGLWLLAKFVQFIVWLVKLPFRGIRALALWLWSIVNEVLRKILVYGTIGMLALWYIYLAVYTWSFNAPVAIMFQTIVNFIVFLIIKLFYVVIEFIKYIFHLIY